MITMYTHRRFTGFNKLKLQILFLCKDTWKTSLEVSSEIPDYPKDQIQSRLSGLNRKYDRPYLRARRRKGKLIQYKCTVKGKRVLGKLLTLFRNGEELHIVWKTQDQGKSILEQMKRDPVKPRVG